jgi:hypothetical protein
MRRIALSIAIAISAVSVAPASGARAASGSVTATEGAGFSGQVATLTTSRCDTIPITTGPSGTISWGDGQTSSASYAPVAGTTPRQYTVSGSHTYAEEGTYVASVNSSYTCDNTFASSSGFSAHQVRVGERRGRVAGSGIHRRILYTVKPVPGQRVVFIERSNQVLRQLGAARGRTGSIAFTATPGPQRRQILANVYEQGTPGPALTVASYQPPQRVALAAVRRIRVDRSGARATLSWATVPHAPPMTSASCSATATLASTSPASRA